MNNNRSIKWKTSTFSRNGTTQYTATINGTKFTIHKSNEKDWLVRLGDSDGKLIHACDTLKLAKRWCDFDAHNTYRKKNEEYINAMLDGVIEDTRRIPRSVHPLDWSNKVGGKWLKGKGKTVASINQLERNKLAKEYRIGRADHKSPKGEIMTQKEKKKRQLGYNYVWAKRNVNSLKTQGVKTLFLGKGANEEIDYLLDEVMRAARSVNTQAWIRNVNSKRQAHKGNANHAARKERAAELMKMRRDGNTSGLKMPQIISEPIHMRKLMRF